MNGHARLIKLGLETHPVHATRLLNAYSSFWLLNQAHKVFDQVPESHRDTPLWTSLISAYSRSTEPHTALHLFTVMIRNQRQQDPCGRPNHFTYTAVAGVIGFTREDHICLGQAVHGRVIKSGFMHNNLIVETAFLNMYAKCSRIQFAAKLFDEMQAKNLVTWNVMVSAYVQNGMEWCGLDLFRRMKCGELVLPDDYTVASVLQGCASVQDLVLGVQVHAYAIVSGFESDCVSLLANMYFYCSEVASAEKVLDDIEESIEEDVVLKLIKIRGYVFNNQYKDALRNILFGGIQIFSLDYSIVVPILTACAKLSLLKTGKQVHGIFIALGGPGLLEKDGAIVGSALIDMYGKCGDIGEARRVFDSRVSREHGEYWSSMISGYIYNGLVEEARMLLEHMPEKSVASWTSMMTGYVQNGMPLEGLNLLARMYRGEGGFVVDGNCLTFVVGLEACSYLTDLEKGKQIHSKIIRNLVNADSVNVIIGTALVDMYSKSGNLCYAQNVFELMVEKNVVTWTSLIMGYAVHGFGLHALKLFRKMMQMGIKPNDITFIAVLTACSHCGLVDEGLEYFRMMTRDYGLAPREDHYTCLIDMLGRVGRLEQAWCLLEEIEFVEVAGGCSMGTVFAAMLGACYLHRNLELGDRVATKMLEKGNQLPAAYITLSNVYAAAGMWNEAFEVRENWRQEGIRREPGLSSICTNSSSSGLQHFTSSEKDA